MLLSKFRRVYLATPYSRFPDGLEAAFIEAAKLAARLMAKGVRVYSPIVHTHPMAVFGEIDALDHSIWMPFDEAMMEACCALAVAQLPTWEQSKGVKHEIDYFELAGKPIFFLDPHTLHATPRL